MSLLLYERRNSWRLWFDGRWAYRTDEVLYGALPRTSGYVTLDGHEVLPVRRRMAWQTALFISPKTET